MMSRIILLALICVAAAAETALRGPKKMLQMNYDVAAEAEKNKKVSAEFAYEHQDQMEEDVHWDLTMDTWKDRRADAGMQNENLKAVIDRIGGTAGQVNLGGADAKEADKSSALIQDEQTTRWQDEAQVVADMHDDRNKDMNFEEQVSDGQQFTEQGATGTEQDQAQADDNEEEERQNALDEATADQEDMTGEFAKKTFKTTDDKDGTNNEEQSALHSEYKDYVQHNHDAKIKRLLDEMDRREKRQEKHKKEDEAQKQEMMGMMR